MGTKFANIHMKETDINKVELCIKNHIEKNDTVNLKWASNILKSEGISLDLISNLLQDTYSYCIGRIHPEWVTVLNSNFAWESIKEIGVKFSKSIQGLILAVGYFDDDVFSIHLIKNGKVLTSHVSGDGASCYGEKERLGDIELLIRELKLDISTENLQSILEMEDLQKKVEELEKITLLPLWMKEEWLEDAPKEFRDKFITVN